MASVISTGSFTSQNLYGAAAVANMTTLPAKPAFIRVEMHVTFTFPDAASRQIIILMGKDDGGGNSNPTYLLWYGYTETATPNEVISLPPIPMILPASAAPTVFWMWSDNALDTSVSCAVNIVAVDADYTFHYAATPGDAVADSPGQRNAAIDDLTQASGDGDLAAILEDTGELQTDDVPGLIGALNDLDAAQVKTALEADGSKLDHLWETTEDDAGTRRLTENALEQAPSGTGATVEEIDAELTSTHGAGDWNASGATVNVLPLAGSPSASGRLSPLTITAYQHTTINATISITDSDGDPVDLSAKDLALVAWHKDTPATTVIEMLSAGVGAELSVGGVDGNQVTIAGGVAHTVTARQLDWRLYNLTDLTAVATGVLKIEEGAALPT